ncbi:MAG: hypothetical protein ACOC2W_03520 [bacterium]
MVKNKKNIDLENDRYGLFMNDKSYDLEIMYGRHYINTDISQKILLHRINVIESKSHDLYGQSKPKDKQYFPPIEVNCFLQVEDNEQKTYGDENGLVRDDSGSLIINVYLDEIKEKNIEFTRGDIIEYNMSGDYPRFYEVYNANNVTDTTSHTIAGFKPYYKKITSLPVKEDVTHLLNINKD